VNVQSVTPIVCGRSTWTRVGPWSWRAC